MFGSMLVTANIAADNSWIYRHSFISSVYTWHFVLEKMPLIWCSSSCCCLILTVQFESPTVPYISTTLINCRFLLPPILSTPFFFLPSFFPSPIVSSRFLHILYWGGMGWVWRAAGFAETALLMISTYTGVLFCKQFCIVNLQAKVAYMVLQHFSLTQISYVGFGQ